jgi:hypothetical protein
LFCKYQSYRKALLLFCRSYPPDTQPTHPFPAIWHLVRKLNVMQSRPGNQPLRGNARDAEQNAVRGRKYSLSKPYVLYREVVRKRELCL